MMWMSKDMAWTVSAVTFRIQRTMRIYTIGYEGATIGGSSRALQAAGVERFIDVRGLPLSRRPGFSKTPLSGAFVVRGHRIFPP